MARKGRELEKLIANLEEKLAPSGALIKSPDYLKDLETGNDREVDISIKYKVGSVPILITIECRDRTNKDDCTWIEQLAQKQRSIGANKTVAVSSAGFSEPALCKAKKLGIEARTLKKLKPNDIDKLFSELLLSIFYKKLTMVGGHVEFYYHGDNSVSDVAIKDIPHDADFMLSKAFKTKGENIFISLMDIAKDTIERQVVQHIQNKEFDANLKHNCEFNFNPGQITSNTNYGELSVKKVELKYELIIENLKLSPKSAVRYGQDENAIVEKLEIETTLNESPFMITVNKISNESNVSE